MANKGPGNTKSYSSRRSKRSKRNSIGASDGPFRGTRVIIPEAEKSIEDFVTMVMEKKIDGLRREFEDSIKHITSQVSEINGFKAHPSANRNPNIPCLEATRFRLQPGTEGDSDYIHASSYKIDDYSHPFILTQLPIASTVNDFWRLVFQSNASCIILCCPSSELPIFSPPSKHDFKTYGLMIVSNKRTEEVDSHVSITFLEVLPEGCSNSNIVKLIHIQDWKRGSIPASPLCLLRILRTCETMPELKAGVPIIVSEFGIGRAGVIAAIAAGIKRLLRGKSLDMKDLVQDLRNHRAMAIDTADHYVTVHLAIVFFASAKLYRLHPKIYKIYQDYKK